MTLTHVSLFTGYAGFDLALKLTGIEHRTILYVEIEKYCQEIIRQRIRDGFLDDAPIWSDVRTLDGRLFVGKVDILTAGFPCQPHSVAGSRKGSADERNLWPDTFRLISEMGPKCVILENVPGILTNGYAGTVIGELSEIGYDCEWRVVGAYEVNAPHTRERLWIIASYSSPQRRNYRITANRRNAISDNTFWIAAKDCRNWARWQRWLKQNVSDGHWCKNEAVFCGMDDGTPEWMESIEAIGNGIVPAVAAKFLNLVDFSLCSGVNSKNDYYSDERS